MGKIRQTYGKEPETQPVDAQGRALCMCGCGQLAPISEYNHGPKGYVKGQPRKYVQRHSPFVVRHQMTPPNPGGLCLCGCGQITPICVNTDYRRGNIQGEHLRYVQGHNSKTGPNAPKNRAEGGKERA